MLSLVFIHKLSIMAEAQLYNVLYRETYMFRRQNSTFEALIRLGSR